MKAIKLKILRSKEEAFMYALLPCTESSIEATRVNKGLDKSILDFAREQNIITFDQDIEGIYYLGELDKFSSYGQLVYKFPLTKRQIVDKKKEQFRDYGMDIEKQKEYMHLVILCSSAAVSWKTAIKASGSKFGVICKVKLHG